NGPPKPFETRHDVIKLIRSLGRLNAVANQLHQVRRRDAVLTGASAGRSPRCWMRKILEPICPACEVAEPARAAFGTTKLALARIWQVGCAGQAQDAVYILCSGGAAERLYQRQVDFLN